MKTPVLKIFLLSGLLGWGVNKAKASSAVTSTTLTTTAGSSGLASDPLSSSHAGVAVLGFNLAATGTTNTAITVFTFTATTPIPIGTNFSSFKLYSSTNNSYTSGSDPQVPNSSAIVSGNTITVTITTGSFAITKNTNKNFFLVADFGITNAASSTVTFNITGVTGPTNNSFPDSGPTYNITPVVLGNTLTTGLASGTLSVSAPNQAILGFSVTTTQTELFSSFQFTPTQPIGNYFTNLRLYSNTTNNYSTGTKTLITTIASPSATTSLNISGLSQTIASTTKYYFIVADYTVGGSASVSFQLSANSATTASTTFTYGGDIDGPALTLSSATYNWVGGTSVSGVYPWLTPANWSPASVPGAFDKVQIGVTTYTNGHDPTVTTAATVSSITFGSNNGNNMAVNVSTGITLDVNGDITKQSDNQSETATLAGNGTINAVNINVFATDQTNFAILSIDTYTEAINSSVATLNVSGNVSLTGDVYGSLLAIIIDQPAFNVTGGTTNFTGTTSSTGVLSSNNAVLNTFFGTYYSNCIFSVKNGTLNVYNPTFLSGLDGSGTNYINFNNTGSLIQYKGGNQTVYTSSAANTNTGVTYYNLITAGTGTATTTSGILTVSNDLTTSSTTNFATNSTTVNVTDNWVNTSNVTQGSAAVTVSNILQNNSGTITGGSGALTAQLMQFNGGNLNCSTGTVTCKAQYQNNAGAFNCSSGPVFFDGGYQNNAGTFNAGTGMVTFLNSQTLVDNSTTGTTFNNVTFTNTGNAQMSAGAGNFAVSNIGTLTMSANSKLTAGSGSAGGAGYLTLLSGANSTATVAQIPASSFIVGAVNAQRYITGGAGTRGYKLLSSPVNISLATLGNMSLAYLNANGSFGGTTYPGVFTEGPGSGFTVNGSSNPIIYLYDESRTTNNTGFTSGKNVGIYNIFSTVVTTLTGTTQANATIPVGNSYLLYFVGNNTSPVVANTRIPDNTTITATGYLNQGGATGIPVKFWNTGTTLIPVHNNGGNLNGLNQVGNPFASTISLDQLYLDNYSLATNPISDKFWELLPSGGYVSYSALAPHNTSDTRASKYIVSGQGFLVQGTSLTITTEHLTFFEGEKVSLPANFSAATTPKMMLDMPTTASASNADTQAPANLNDPALNSTAPQAPNAIVATGLHMQIAKDSVNYGQTGIYFNNNWSDKFLQTEDAVAIDGGNALMSVSSFSADGVKVGINQLGDYTKGKRIKLYTSATSTGLYTMSLADILNIDTNMYRVYLIDNKMNDSLDMVHYKSYAFNINNADTTTYGANRFVLAIEHPALPKYKLIKFTGEKTNAGIQLNWQTLNEGNYIGFALQKLVSGNNYTSLYITQSTGVANYNYVDKHPVNGNNTYRLQQTDINGNVTYSSPLIITYNTKAPNGSLTIYPNPSKSVITISLSSNSTSNYIADIYSTSGNLIGHRSVNTNTWTEDISAYKLGVYILELKTNTGDLVGKSKFVKIN